MADSRGGRGPRASSGRRGSAGPANSGRSGSPTSRTSRRTSIQSTTRHRPEVEATSVDSPPKPRFRIQRTQRLLVVAVAAALLLLLYGGTLNAYIHQQRQIAQTKQEIEDHRESIASLEEEIDRWNDPEYVKTQARERLGWVLPGETGFRVVGPDGQPYGGGAGINGRNLPDREDNAWWDTMWGSVITADDPEPGTGSSVPSTVPSTTSGEPPR